jgi:2-succinyl-5-enolpyruvyl-6-hydroxy-3-cyclohexene-1-carboxylate synthase
LTVILINNNGGGIFENLPISKFDPPFEEYFVTPQNVDFEKLADAHGVGYKRVQTWTHFLDLIKKLPEKGLRIIEIRTDRKRDAEFRKKLLDETNYL